MKMDSRSRIVGLCFAFVFTLLFFVFGVGFVSFRKEQNEKLGKQLPSWVPLYKGAQGTRSEPMGMPSLNPWKVEGVATLFTDDSPEQVIQHYLRSLPTLGFETSPLIIEDDRVRLPARAPRKGRELEVAAGSNSQNTWIALHYTWNR